MWRKRPLTRGSSLRLREGYTPVTPAGGLRAASIHNQPKVACVRPSEALLPSFTARRCVRRPRARLTGRLGGHKRMRGAGRK
eukprot:4831793-Pyramimonas_sp.AAC.2